MKGWGALVQAVPKVLFTGLGTPVNNVTGPGYYADIATDGSLTGIWVNAAADQTSWSLLFAGTPSSGAVSLIASQILASTTASVTFSSIPGTFNHLLIKATTRSTRASYFDALAMQFNGDTAAHYDEVETYNNGGGVAGANETGQTVIGNSASDGPIPAASVTAGVAGSLEIEIPVYAQTTLNKAGHYRAGFAAGVTGAFDQLFSHFAWRSTAAITSIKLALNTGSWVAGSAFYLYGVT